jgi:RNA polymerase sigma-70 factor (ECF subfamily)
LINRTLVRLEREYTRAGKLNLFESLKSNLTRSGSRAHHAQVAEKMGMTEGAVKVAAHRMRRRFRELLRAEIVETVATEDQVDDEIRYLMRVVSS